MKVLIVGAGIAGPTLAFWLHKRVTRSPSSNTLPNCAAVAT